MNIVECHANGVVTVTPGDAVLFRDFHYEGAFPHHYQFWAQPKVVGMTPDLTLWKATQAADGTWSGVDVSGQGVASNKTHPAPYLIHTPVRGETAYLFYCRNAPATFAVKIEKRGWTL